METLAYKCPNCNADLKFNAAEQKFTCEYCASSFTEQEMKEIAAQIEQYVEQRPETEVQTDTEFSAHTSVYSCDSCGATIMADDNTAATFCYYCHNPVILKGRVDGKFRPSYVLPFQIDRAAALAEFQKYCDAHKFLPSKFRSEGQMEKVVGLYVPFWVTDVDINAEMDALCKKIRSWTSGDYHYTETKEYAAARKAKIHIKGLPADGASHIADELMEAVEPFDYTKIRPFAMQYLSGFFAEKYDVDFAGMFPRIQARATQASDQLVRASFKGYNSVSVTNSDIKIMNTEWKYMLLPVWFMSFKYAGKTYEFALNGQSGKLVGDPPLSKAKAALFAGGIGLAIAIISFFVGVFRI